MKTTRIQLGTYDKIKDKRVKYKHDGRCIDCGVASDRCRCEKCRAARASHMRFWRANNLEHSREMQKKWRLNHLERDKIKQVQYRVKRKYGLTLHEYQEIMKNPCGICGGNKNIILDHCHINGNVRGALCVGCNGRLGWYEKYKQPIEDWVKFQGKQ
jgi:hypothetical protein